MNAMAHTRAQQSGEEARIPASPFGNPSGSPFVFRSIHRSKNLPAF